MTTEQNAQELKRGSVIEYLNGRCVWVKSTIYKTTGSYVWFAGSGYDRIKRTTFINHPELYRIVQA